MLDGVLVRHTVRMGEAFPWSERASRWRAQMPPEVVAAIDAVGHELAPDEDVETVVAALHTRGLDFTGCMEGLVAIKDVSMSHAKLLVHRHHALADGRDDRDAWWTALYN